MSSIVLPFWPAPAILEYGLEPISVSAQRLPQFLSPLVQDLGRSERRVGATLHVEGLLIDGVGP
jgi:hypothetical protein